MKAMLTNFLTITTDKRKSWNVIVFLAILVILAEAMAFFHLSQFPISQTLALFKGIHAFVGVLILAIALGLRGHWKMSYSIYCYLALYVPFYFLEFYREVLIVRAPEILVPLLSMKLHFLILAFIVPGPYWVSMLMILLFFLDFIFTWFYLDLEHLPHIPKDSEPFTTLMCFFLGILFLLHRYREERIGQALNREKINAEIYERLTQIFLYIRDQANTPLQGQKILLDLLEKRCPESKELIDALAKTVMSLTEMSELLSRFEPETFLKEHKLMNEQEMLEYLRHVHSEYVGKSKS